jgi:hypothetical protein
VLVKLVINKCYGGFGLSEAAYARLIELGVPTCPWDNENHGLAIADMQHPESNHEGALNAAMFSSLVQSRYYASWTREEEHRSHPLIVQVVEELGDKANGRCARLRVVEIPDGVDFEIDEYDGMEKVRETSRSWE